MIIYEGFWSLPIRLQLFIGHFPRGSSGPKGVILCPLNNIHSSRNLYPQTEADCRMPRSTILSLSQNSGNLEKRASTIWRYVRYYGLPVLSSSGMEEHLIWILSAAATMTWKGWQELIPWNGKCYLSYSLRQFKKNNDVFVKSRGDSDLESARYQGVMLAITVGMQFSLRLHYVPYLVDSGLILRETMKRNKESHFQPIRWLAGSGSNYNTSKWYYLCSIALWRGKVLPLVLLFSADFQQVWET